MRSILLLIGFIGLVESARILAFLPFPGKSHQLVFDPILRELALKGHTVHAYKGTPLSDPPPNYTEVIAPNLMDENMKKEFDFVEFGKMGPLGQLITLYEIGFNMCNVFYQTDYFKSLMAANEGYDLIIHESLFAQESTAALAHRFNAPQVLLMPLGNSHWTNHIMDNPFNPAYLPDYKVVSTDTMTFMERLINTYASASAILIGEFFYLPKFQSLVDKYFVYPGSETRPPLRDLLRNISLAVQNSHFSINGPAPQAPNLLSIGGIHIRPNKPLDKELKTWIDGAKNGVIYFSFGTVIQPDLVLTRVESAFTSAFSKLKQRIIWKYNGVIKNKPANVLISSWLPQQDILAHKNVKLFITHGGFLSVSEAVNFGVPLVGTPFFGDQQKNLKAVVDDGFGVQLNFDNITEKSVLWAVDEVLSNPRYTERVKFKSALFRDRPVMPLQEVVFWIDYVIRHKGAAFLRPASSKLFWFQAYLLDVVTVIAVPLLAILAILYFMLKIMISYLFCRGYRAEKMPVKKKNQ